MISPALFLALLIGLTGVAWAADVVRRRWRQAQLGRLAAQWGMQYCREDRFRLTARLAGCFPVCGAAHVRIRDIIYGSRDDGHHYIFTVCYTTGIVQTQRHRRRVAAMLEPHQREETATSPAIKLADADLPLIEQYQEMQQGGKR